MFLCWLILFWEFDSLPMYDIKFSIYDVIINGFFNVLYRIALHFHTFFLFCHVSGVPKIVFLSHKNFHLSKKEPRIWIQHMHFRGLFYGTEERFLEHPIFVLENA